MTEEAQLTTGATYDRLATVILVDPVPSYEVVQIDEQVKIMSIRAQPVKTGSCRHHHRLGLCGFILVSAIVQTL